MAEFLRCRKCGKIVEVVAGGAPETVCCGEDMAPLRANTTDGASEKHVPVVSIDGWSVSVRVGSAVHPMEDDHYIQWIALETDRGIQRKWLSPGAAPEAGFALVDGEVPVAAYEYCNKHGLWKVDL